MRKKHRLPFGNNEIIPLLDRDFDRFDIGLTHFLHNAGVPRYGIR